MPVAPFRLYTGRNQHLKPVCSAMIEYRPNENCSKVITLATGSTDMFIIDQPSALRRRIILEWITIGYER